MLKSWLAARLRARVTVVHARGNRQFQESGKRIAFIDATKNCIAGTFVSKVVSRTMQLLVGRPIVGLLAYKDAPIGSALTTARNHVFLVIIHAHGYVNITRAQYHAEYHAYGYPAMLDARTSYFVTILAPLYAASHANNRYVLSATPPPTNSQWTSGHELWPT